MKRISLMSLFFVALLALPTVGCGDDHDHDDHDDHANHDHNNHANHGDENHACIHFEEGPNVSISGAADSMSDLPETFEEHTRIDVELPADADTAFVTWTAEEAGEFEFWLTDDVPFALLDGETELMPEESGGAAMGCEELAVVHHKFAVEAKAYTVRIGPATAGQTIGFVAEHKGEDHSH